MILAISSPDDGHATAVLGELERGGAEAILLDLSRFPTELGLAVGYDGARSASLLYPGGEVLDLGGCGAIWWRRPQPFATHPELARTSHASFAYAESLEAFGGVWQTLDAFWVNDPARDEVAARKVYQLAVGRSVGLETPATLVTNDPARARAFVDERGHASTVYKTFSATPQEWRETRVLRAEEVALLDAVRYAPVIFQEYVPGVDLRITVVGDQVFPAAIHAEETSYPVDFRMDIASARIEPAELPDDVQAGIRKLMDALGLVYGAIDMRRRADGSHVFLEINPAGQWLFVEERTGQPITAALASLLADRDARARS